MADWLAGTSAQDLVCWLAGFAAATRRRPAWHMKLRRLSEARSQKLQCRKCSRNRNCNAGHKIPQCTFKTALQCSKLRCSLFRNITTHTEYVDMFCSEKERCGFENCFAVSKTALQFFGKTALQDQKLHRSFCKAALQDTVNGLAVLPQMAVFTRAGTSHGCIMTKTG